MGPFPAPVLGRMPEIDEPDPFLCPITLELFREPVRFRMS